MMLLPLMLVTLPPILAFILVFCDDDAEEDGGRDDDSGDGLVGSGFRRISTRLAALP